MRPVAEQMAARLFGPEPSPELTARIMAVMLATSPAGAAVVVLDGVGQLPNLERPDAFNEHLLRFPTRALP